MQLGPSFPRLLSLVLAGAVVAGCGDSGGDPTPPTSATSQPATAALGDFREFPQRLLPESVASALQTVLDDAVEEGTVLGVTAAVIVADTGSWSGATGVDLAGNALTRDARLPVASVGKTVTAAQVLRLIDEGKLRLDDPAAEHLPPGAASFHANGATIRDLLGMRSGIPDPAGYEALVDSGLSPIELLKEIPEPLFPAGSEISYANINFILLGMIIEHVTGRPLSEVLRSGVLERPGLDGVVYSVKGALAADGWRIEADPASLARWGYELYGGFVLSPASLRQMADFRDGYYGLGAIDFSQTAPAIVGGIGHGGLEPSIAVFLAAFPEAGVVVAVQANTADGDAVKTMVAPLRDAAQP